MPALNFQKRFAPLVESGQKRQTIRAHRRDGRPNATIGGRLYLYTGMRTKGCRKLGEAICTRVRSIEIFKGTLGIFYIQTKGQLLSASGKEANRLARADGFNHASEMCRWIEETHGLPFHGVVIGWSDSVRIPEGQKDA